MRYTHPLRLLLVLLLFVSLLACTQWGMRSITSGELRSHVEYLASDELGGRETGEQGIRMAEEYIAASFKESGLTPLPGQPDYFIDFNLYRSGFDTKVSYMRVDIGGREAAGEPGIGFRPFGFSEIGEGEAEVVFAGYGITASEYGYDDYDGLDAAGKYVLILRHEPQSGLFGTTGYTRHAYFKTKADNARRHGAAGMILFTDPFYEETLDDLRLMGDVRLEPTSEQERKNSAKERDSPFLAVHISRDLAVQMLRPLGLGLEEIQRAVDSGEKPRDLILRGVTAGIGVKLLSSSEKIRARNVAGMLEGSDPSLKEEWVVIGGHHDHVGSFVGTGDTVYNGADDNASGTSGVLELAEAFAGFPIAPKRTLVFVTFSAEEMGLFGSRALVEQKLIPAERVKFMLNLDMIGRNSEGEIHLYSGGRVTEFSALIDDVNADLGLPVRYMGVPHEGYSDYYPFYNAGVPFLFIFTGYHEDYHKPSDHADKLDYPRMEVILRLAFGILDRLAESQRAFTP